MQGTRTVADFVPLGTIELIPIAAGDPSPAEIPCYFEAPGGWWESIPFGTAEAVPAWELETATEV